MIRVSIYSYDKQCTRNNILAETYKKWCLSAHVLSMNIVISLRIKLRIKLKYNGALI